ncbi:zf-HC2 domain-containing protein [Paenibacillus sp. J2TS4]|uniref:zf-HC2 domain-containing protein n=1 Tax=Paenibacillus sp. J2TS4 TaxID=2807194 RepID=UPI001B03BDE4|nr:zf-HC2 domain-containing protein [Paenibacillus sp. J2TS4]GIP32493.1 hypothetical protein J2TS4_17030 [Paenibacillus sp. J2TS4]
MNTCNVAKDLIPLYVEGLTNEDSTALVEQHLAECADCKSYYEMIKQDYDKQTPVQPDNKQLDKLMAQLAKYQQNIKLAGVLLAMLMTSIIHGAGVQFMSTLPFLILVPFVCRLYYNKSLPILLSSIVFGVIGGLLSENHVSFVPVFTFLAFLSSCVGVGAGILMKLGLQRNWRVACSIAAGALLIVSCLVFFSLSGNPVGYVQTMSKTKEYVNQTYEKGTLTFKGVVFNFKDKQHYGKFEYVLNQTRQTALIGINYYGEVNDSYKYALEMQFVEERSAELKTEIAAAVDYSPLTIAAKPEEVLHITQDEINNRYYHLSYDLDKRNKATGLRKSESGKLRYEISFGPFSHEYDKLSKEQFIAKSTAILRALQARQVPYHSIQISALDMNGGQLQTVSFTHPSTVQQLIESYVTEDFPPQPKK